MAKKSNVTINGRDAKEVMAHYQALPCLIQALSSIANPGNKPQDVPAQELARKALVNWDKNRVKDIGEITVRATVVNGNGG